MLIRIAHERRALDILGAVELGHSAPAEQQPWAEISPQVVDERRAAVFAMWIEKTIK